MKTLSLLERAREIAHEAHSGQTRWNGDPYITHPARVAAQMRYTEHEIVAWLHDVVEDTNVTLDDLRAEGFSEAVINAVDAITHRDGESYCDYLRRLRNDPFATVVKIADLTDNLTDLNRPKDRQRREKYEVARMFLQDC